MQFRLRKLDNIQDMLKMASNKFFIFTKEKKTSDEGYALCLIKTEATQLNSHLIKRKNLKNLPLKFT